ncbi:hypothetical protein LTR50_003610 [Elasticomyces elasticus]|nr:hypothetical protein LTR50_003610 [Elasticomyces elasticus]
MLDYHSLKHDYTALIQHHIPGPNSISYFIPFILLPLALLIPPSVLSRWQLCAVFLPVIYGCVFHAWIAMEGVDVISVDKLLWATYFLALKDTRREFRRLSKVVGRYSRENANAVVSREKDVPEVRDVVRYEESYPERFSERLFWVGELLISLRLTDWKINEPSHDMKQPAPPTNPGHLRFITTALLRTLRGYLILDLAAAYIASDSYFTDPRVSVFSPLPHASGSFINNNNKATAAAAASRAPTTLLAPSILHTLALLPPPLLRSTIIGLQAWATISELFHLPCILPVALHALGLLPPKFSPHLWPPYFGSASAVLRRGVAGLWGKYWHQTMRVSVSAPGRALAAAMGLRRGGLARGAVVAGVSFGLSGVVHMGMVPSRPLRATRSPWTIRLLVAAFFWAQALGLLLEAAVARFVVSVAPAVARRVHGRSVLRRVVNAVWVVFWMCVTLPLLGEAGRQMGYWRVWPVPVSLVRWMAGEGWVAWPILQ